MIAARLGFVFVFQFTVYLITKSITKFVPDVPKGFALKAKREKDRIKEVFGKKQEMTAAVPDPNPVTLSGVDSITESRPSEPAADIQPLTEHAPTVVTVDAEKVGNY